MKVAVTYDNGNVLENFGNTKFFKVYDIENGETQCTEIVSSMGANSYELANMLAMMTVDALICGEIAENSITELTDEGIVIYSGCCGDADEAVNALVCGNLSF